MAEAKYDLLLVNTKKDDVIRNQPWWKERLRTKYIKSLGPGDTSQFLQGQNWTFLKDGLDDFRDGLPPATEDGVVIMGHKGLAPNIQGSSDSDTPVKQPAVRNRFSKHEICYSRVTPQQQQRRDHINEIEYGLTQHPLALYPHLEECMPPDVFEDVVDILDPEMNIASEAGEDSLLQEEDEDGYREETPPRVPTNYEQAEDEGSQDGEHRIKNPYRWWPRKEEKDRKDKKKAAERRASSPSQDEHIKGVTKEFCDWVASLGGESNNIEESTITSLFASGYETKPALSVPIHVVELTNVPPELRMSAAVPPAQQNQQTAMGADDQKKSWVHSGSYEPSWVKFQYGAWYLQPKTWKKRTQGEPLKDPKEIKDHEMSEAKKKSNDMDNELAAMHGSQAFMDFIDKKDSRRPEFLEKVCNIKDEKLREEIARRERDSPHAVRHPKTKIIISSARSGRT